MSGFEGEEERQKRAVYLHEAGHAVVAIHCNNNIIEVICDGKTGHVEATPPSQYERRMSHARTEFQNAAPEDRRMLSDAYLDIFESHHLKMLGGVAGENLEPGRSIPTLFRGAEDLTFIYGDLLYWFQSFARNDQPSLITKRVTQLFELVSRVINSKETLVIAIADALEEKTKLTTEDIASIIAKTGSS